MQDFWISITPEPADINLRLDQFLALRYPQFSRSHWQSRIKRSQVLLNSRGAKPNETVKKDSTIKYLVSRPDEPQVNDDIQFLYNKDGLLVVDKPADLPVHPGGSYFKGTLVEILKEQHGLDYIAPIQRLDRETSGVIPSSIRASDDVELKFVCFARCPSIGDMIKNYLNAIRWCGVVT